MILDSRQIKFDVMLVPNIERWTTLEIEFNYYFESLREKLLEVLLKKYKHVDETLFNDSIKQTLNFLLLMGALKELPGDIELVKEIELWKEFVELEPVYEGITIQLKTMLIKHHFPSMYKEMSKGHVYSHYSLTMIKEAVLYTIEYLQKNKLLRPQKEFLERDNVNEWLKMEVKK